LNGTNEKINEISNGISFRRAATIFNGRVLQWEDNRKSYGEERRIAIGRTEARICQVVYTLRNRNIRIISPERQRKMKDENISSYTLDEIDGQIDETDWERVDKMTDEDLYKMAQSDPAAQPLSETELNCFKRAIYANGEMMWEDEQTVGELLATGEKYALIPVDREVLEWFEKANDRYLAKMNAVLRIYIESQEN
jgi:uncharacterized DUF497 family protein